MAVKWDVDDILGRNTSAISVVILNQPIHCPPDVLLPIWNRGVVRVVVDGGSDRWREYVERVAPTAAIPLPDCVTGDYDSIVPATADHLRAQRVRFLPTPDQDLTDFSKALQVVDTCLEEKKLSSEYCVCVCEHGGRLDQTLRNLETLHLAQSWQLSWRPVILSENGLTWLLPPGRHTILVPEVCVARSLPCGLIPLLGPTTVTTNGLKWDLDNGILSFGKLVSTSNTFKRTNIEVETSQPLVWTMLFSEIIPN